MNISIMKNTTSENDFFELLSNCGLDSRHKEYESKKDKSTYFTFLLQGKKLLSLPDFVFEEFPETLKLFDSSNNLSLPPSLDFDTKFIKSVLGSFFFYKEVKKLHFTQVARVLKIASFLKINPLIQNIVEFMERPLKTNDKSTTEKLISFLKGSFDLLESPQEKENHISKFVIKASSYFFQQKLYDEFLYVFDKNILSLPSIDTIFEFLLNNVIKNFNPGNDFVMHFFSVFAPHVETQKKKTSLFRKDYYFARLLKEFINIKTLDIKTLTSFLEDNKLSSYQEITKFLSEIVEKNVEYHNEKIADIGKDLKHIMEKKLKPENEKMKVPLKKKSIEKKKSDPKQGEPIQKNKKGKCLRRLFCQRKDNNENGSIFIDILKWIFSSPINKNGKDILIKN